MMIGDQPIAALDSRGAGAGRRAVDPVGQVAEGAGPHRAEDHRHRRARRQIGRDRRHRRHFRQRPEGVSRGAGRAAPARRRRGADQGLALSRQPRRGARAQCPLHPGGAAAQRLRAEDDGGREHGLPHLRRRRGRQAGELDQHGRDQGLCRAAGRAVQGQDRLARLADPGAVGRQCPARRAGPRTDRRGRSADRLQPLLRARLLGGGRNPRPHHEGAQRAAPRCC